MRYEPAEALLTADLASGRLSPLTRDEGGGHGGARVRPAAGAGDQQPGQHLLRGGRLQRASGNARKGSGACPASGRRRDQGSGGGYPRRPLERTTPPPAAGWQQCGGVSRRHSSSSTGGMGGGSRNGRGDSQNGGSSRGGAGLGMGPPAQWLLIVR